MNESTTTQQAGFVPHRAAKDRRDSAIALAAAVAAMDLEPVVKKKALDLCLWFVTESEGLTKYRTKHMSQAAIGQSSKHLHHEHVVPRKALIKAMLEHPRRAGEIAGSAIGCTITRAEHAILTNQDRQQSELKGWDRYRAAGIVVIDTSTGIAI